MKESLMITIIINFFLDIDDVLSKFNLIQLVKFKTWSRMVSTEKRSSILDHVYIKDRTVISKLSFVNPFFGDHVLVEFIINAKKCENENQR